MQDRHREEEGFLGHLYTYEAQQMGHQHAMVLNYFVLSKMSNSDKNFYMSAFIVLGKVR